MKNPGFFDSPPETIEIEDIQKFNQVEGRVDEFIS
jgi:hypothetical protein